MKRKKMKRKVYGIPLWDTEVAREGIVVISQIQNKPLSILFDDEVAEIEVLVVLCCVSSCINY